MESLSSVNNDDIFSLSPPSSPTNSTQSSSLIYWLCISTVVGVVLYLAKDYILDYLSPYLSLGQPKTIPSPAEMAGPSPPPPPPTQNPNNSLNTALQKAEQDQQQTQSSPDYTANDSYSSNLEGKSGWCYVGEDQGQRACSSVGYADTCMSGKIFPTQDICVNPSLRP